MIPVERNDCVFHPSIVQTYIVYENTYEIFHMYEKFYTYETFLICMLSSRMSDS